MTDISREIKAELLRNGISEARAWRALGLSQRSWARRLADPDSFRASEIKQLRKLIPEEVCDRITK